MSFPTTTHADGSYTLHCDDSRKLSIDDSGSYTLRACDKRTLSIDPNENELETFDRDFALWLEIRDDCDRLYQVYDGIHDELVDALRAYDGVAFDASKEELQDVVSAADELLRIIDAAIRRRAPRV